jgi:hypothetical protein
VHGTCNIVQKAQKGELQPAAPFMFMSDKPLWMILQFFYFIPTHNINLVFLICKSTMFIFIHLYICHISYISVFLLSLLYCISLILPVCIRFILLMKTEIFSSLSPYFSIYSIYLIFDLYISLLLFPSQMEIHPFPFLYISMFIPLNIIIFLILHLSHFISKYATSTFLC